MVLLIRSACIITGSNAINMLLLRSKGQGALDGAAVVLVQSVDAAFMKYPYVRLYCDSNGESHFEDLDTELSPTNFAPGTPPLFVSVRIAHGNVSFFGAPAGWAGDWHISASRNLFVVISGVWQIEASDGELRTFRESATLLVEDTSGNGHRSRVIGSEDSLALLIQLE